MSPLRARENKDEKDLRRAEAALCDAFRDADAKTIERIEDERYTLTDSRGTVTGRDGDVGEATMRDPRCGEFRNHSQKMRFCGDTAIVNGVTSLKSESGGKAFSGDFQFTDAWVKRNGEWKIVSSHASRLPAKQP
ncbi:MAG: nuclear transport factor 2 family protein [Proteobacteria bacterium]|nr:nuclear transport factor 2 family protein [Pseudomonadota bacterium]